MKIKALMSFRYAGKSVSKGEEFEATEQHAKLLIAVKRAVLVGVLSSLPEVLAEEIVVDKPKRKYQRRDQVAEKPKKSGYKRRDLTADA